jgi:hypothetical protein
MIISADFDENNKYIFHLFIVFPQKLKIDLFPSKDLILFKIL